MELMPPLLPGWGDWLPFPLTREGIDSSPLTRVGGLTPLPSYKGGNWFPFPFIREGGGLTHPPPYIGENWLPLFLTLLTPPIRYWRCYWKLLQNNCSWETIPGFMSLLHFRSPQDLCASYIWYLYIYIYIGMKK